MRKVEIDFAAFAELSPDDSPEPGDYYLVSCGPLGARLFVGRVMDTKSTPALGEYKGENQHDRAMADIQARMETEQFWPNVWNVSDHGNWSLVTE